MSNTFTPLADRQVVFVSHATPEDNAFSTWLTLRLTREGYRVWCDVVKLRGGDDFWKDIETAIRQHTRKFIFVTSRSSNQKPGTLKELAVAEGIARQLNDTGFIIPVKIDDLPYNEHNIQINRLNALNFNQGWAEGLAALLKTLEDDEIQKPEPTGPGQVAAWWNAKRLNHDILRRKPETLWTNWFRLKGMPPKLFAWEIPPDGTLRTDFPFPTYRHGNWLFSFANAVELTGAKRSPTGGQGFVIKPYLGDSRLPPAGMIRSDVARAVKQLLRQAWDDLVKSSGLPTFELSSGRNTLWFPKSNAGDTITYTGIAGGKARRDVCGYKTITKLTGAKIQRYWHFGLEALPILFPFPLLAMKSHVVFTLDGKKISGDAKAQHRARRSQCKDWWNDKWRDLTLAAVEWLAQGGKLIPLRVNSSMTLAMEWKPVKYQSDLGYEDAAVRELPEELQPIESDLDEAEEGDVDEQK